MKIQRSTDRNYDNNVVLYYELTVRFRKKIKLYIFFFGLDLVLENSLIQNENYIKKMYCTVEVLDIATEILISSYYWIFKYTY